MVLRGVVAQQAIESRERQITLAEERVRALELLELVGEVEGIEKAALRALPPKQFCGMIPATRLFVRMFVPLDSPYFYNCLWLWAAVDSLWFP